MSNEPAEPAEPGVASVNRALTILQAFEQSVEGMTLTDLMKATGLYHSTILRLCESLEHFRYLKRLEDGRYMLGPTPFFLGMIYQASFHLRDYALPVLRSLTQATLETAALYVRDGNDRVCLHRIELPRRVRTNVPEGDRVELDKGAAGKVLLAFSGEPGKALDDVRSAVHAVSPVGTRFRERRDRVPGVRCPPAADGGDLARRTALPVQSAQVRRVPAARDGCRSPDEFGPRRQSDACSTRRSQR